MDNAFRFGLIFEWSHPPDLSRKKYNSVPKHPFCIQDSLKINSQDYHSPKNIPHFNLGLALWIICTFLICGNHFEWWLLNHNFQFFIYLYIYFLWFLLIYFVFCVQDFYINSIYCFILELEHLLIICSILFGPHCLASLLKNGIKCLRTSILLVTHWIISLYASKL